VRPSEPSGDQRGGGALADAAGPSIGDDAEGTLSPFPFPFPDVTQVGKEPRVADRHRGTFGEPHVRAGKGASTANAMAKR